MQVYQNKLWSTSTDKHCDTTYSTAKIPSEWSCIVNVDRTLSKLPAFLTNKSLVFVRYS